ncbi:hypothetical protein [Rugamonas sp.]|uniref:hypothetical protein n=1 Tax=Rugamonas sp. TaxID=1926287 RepID=UPI0025EB9133|nr:hypothetical protein [Rugamonas sp.]
MQINTIWETIRRETAWFEPNGESPFQQLVIPPGHYYPRMARPIDPHGFREIDPTPLDQMYAATTAVATGQLAVLTRDLERIFQTVHPNPENFGVYGHDIRNLLILACTEVEAQWRGVLTANGMEGKNFSTKDYFALKGTMKLDEYSVAFPSYPWIPQSNPFRDWLLEKPTQSLAWYDAYNAAKHNREQAFDRANLRHALDAVSACAVLLVAQFGESAESWKRSDAHTFYQFTKVPSWAPVERYFSSYEFVGAWKPMNFSFQR